MVYRIDEDAYYIADRPDDPIKNDDLMKTALDNGGRDNITLILCEIRKRKNGLFRLFQKD